MTFLAAAGAASCSDSSATSTMASRPDALDLGYTPPSSIPVTYGSSPFAGGPTGSNAGSGTLDGAGTGDSDPNSCRSCSMTNYVDLASSLHGQEKSRNLVNATISASSGELATYADTLWNYGSNGGLRGMMKLSASRITGALNGTYASSLTGVASAVQGLLQDFGVTIPPPSVPAPQTWAIAFAPIQSRVKIGEWKCPGTGSCLIQQQIHHDYNAQPLALREARFRGARSYCAMRECAVEQNATGLTSMGESSVESWWLWSFGNGETTIQVAGPVQVGKDQSPATGSTGANVYAIPIAIGARVNPLSGPLFPSIPRVVHPMVWVTGDAEVESQENFVSYYGYRSTWMNSQHADFWAGQYVDGAAITIPEVTIFTWGGLVTAKVSGGMEMTFGKPVEGACGGDPAKSSALADGRGIDFQSGYGCSNYPGYMARSYMWDFKNPANNYRPSAFASDAPFWLAHDPAVLLAPSEDDGVYNAWRATPPPATWTRWTTNDDRSVVLMDSVNEHLSLSVTGGFSLGPVTIGIQGDSTLGDETVQLTTVREQLSAVEGSNTRPYPWTPQNGDGNAILLQTNLVATSETKNTPKFDPLSVKAVFQMEVHLPLLGTIKVHWDQPFFGLETNSTTPAAPINEGRRLRVGEYSDWGTDFTQEGQTGRVVMSHLPTAATPSSPESSPDFFTSWPSGAPDSHDLNACLTDATIPALPDAPDPGQPGAPAGTDSLCWFGPGGYVDGEVKHKVFSLPDDVCTDGVARAAFLASFSNPTLLCLTDMLDYLCSGSYQEQAWGFHGNVVAHVYDQASEAGRVQQIFDECVQDMLAWKNPPTQQLADHFASIYGQMFQLAACNSSATLQGKQP